MDILHKYYIYIKMIINWELEDIKIEKISTGLSNDNYIITNNDEKLLLRIYKNQQKRILYGPKVLASFKDGEIQEYIEGKVLKYEDINNIILKNIAKEFYKIHTIYKINHNDLNFGNIIVKPNNDVVFIDFEYYGELNIEYDLANFLSEWVYDYTKDDWYNYDLNKKPTEEQIKYFCNEYLKCGNNQNKDDFINKVKSNINKAHLYWIKWGYEKNYVLYSKNREKLIE